MLNQAEDEGFKPPIRERRIPDFESSAFGHSANLPFRECKFNKKAREPIPKGHGKHGYLTDIIGCVIGMTAGPNGCAVIGHRVGGCATRLYKHCRIPD